ncbi:nitrous oxide reductase accessory protein NosL [Halorussus amylolyticus]|uniref:nitrous oxide reductase accessory protein NosL n=1 Tax=Halorussus amylolyticus TaxID=1126242 RepID=UPI00104FDEEF|nr:nitrous oxide reductase accessory protein NosL [Halorussus amylolyticus]
MCFENPDGDGRRRGRDPLAVDRIDDSPGPGHPSRRTVLGAVGLATTASLAGCIGDLTGGSEETPEAVSLADGLDCDNCGMVIEQHPGPNGQLFFEDRSPEGHDNPARFDALKQCFFPYKLEREQEGWNAVVGYVTDYSSVEYDVSTQGGTTTISSHTDPASFAEAETLQYVVESEVEGAMGPDFVPFSESEDAESFAEEHGGEVVAYDDIGEGLLGN